MSLFLFSRIRLFIVPLLQISASDIYRTWYQVYQRKEALSYLGYMYQQIRELIAYPTMYTCGMILSRTETYLKMYHLLFSERLDHAIPHTNWHTHVYDVAKIYQWFEHELARF